MAELPTIDSVIAELAPLAGGRIQRVDVVATGEIVLELRVPGRTLRLFISARAPVSRVHLVAARPPKTVEPGALQALLRKRLEGRPLTALRLEGKTVSLEVPETLLKIRLGSGKDAFELVDLPLDLTERPLDRARDAPVPEAFPCSDALERAYQPLVERDTATGLRRRLLTAVDAELKRARRLLERLEGDATKLERYAESRARGELLKGSLHGVKRGQKEAQVMDWATGEMVTIPLDPALDPIANLNRLFTRAKKADRGRPQVLARQNDALELLIRLEEKKKELQAAALPRLVELAEQSDELAPAGARAGAVSPSGERLRPIDRWSRRFMSVDGHEIRVGRGAAENDRLTFNASRGHDLWLHARGVPGAHVLLRLAKGSSPTSEALLDAAHLAIYYSGSKTEARAEVMYAEAKYVRKVKGAPPGQVVVSKDKTIVIRVEEGRMKRLLG